MPNYCIMSLEELAEVREKRYEQLVLTWQSLEYSTSGRFALCPYRTEELIEHYIENLKVIKFRYQIPAEIQLHKVAGLMAYSIIKYKPVSQITSLKTEYDACINEILALFHGLSVCAEYTETPSKRLASIPSYEVWFNDMLHLMHKRNVTPESLAFIFETICMYSFPANFNVTGK
jgi:hypothetical protein